MADVFQREGYKFASVHQRAGPCPEIQRFTVVRGDTALLDIFGAADGLANGMRRATGLAELRGAAAP